MEGGWRDGAHDVDGLGGDGGGPVALFLDVLGMLDLGAQVLEGVRAVGGRLVQRLLVLGRSGGGVLLAALEIISNALGTKGLEKKVATKRRKAEKMNKQGRRKRTRRRPWRGRCLQ